MADQPGLRACSYCGSLDISPTLLFGGPVPWVDHHDGGYECRNCGRTGVPLDFRSMDELEAFRRSIGGAEEQAPQDFVAVPLILMGVQDDGPYALEATWSDGFRATGRAEHALSHKSALKASGHDDVALLDLAGITSGDPAFHVLKPLLRGRSRTWLDIGARGEQDLFDAFTMGAARTLVGTMKARSADLLQEAYGLSDNAVPCVHVHQGRALWGSRRVDADLPSTLRAISDIGFQTLAVIDLDSLGKGRADERLASSAARAGAEVVFGGGCGPEDAERMRSLGLAGMFIDPFRAAAAERDRSPS